MAVAPMMVISAENLSATRCSCARSAICSLVSIDSGQELLTEFSGGLVRAGVFAIQEFGINEPRGRERMMFALLPKDEISEGVQDRDTTFAVREQMELPRDCASRGVEKQDDFGSAIEILEQAGGSAPAERIADARRQLLSKTGKKGLRSFFYRPECTESKFGTEHLRVALDQGIRQQTRRSEAILFARMREEACRNHLPARLRRHALTDSGRGLQPSYGPTDGIRVRDELKEQLHLSRADGAPFR